MLSLLSELVSTLPSFQSGLTLRFRWKIPRTLKPLCISHGDFCSVPWQGADWTLDWTSDCIVPKTRQLSGRPYYDPQTQLGSVGQHQSNGWTGSVHLTPSFCQSGLALYSWVQVWCQFQLVVFLTFGRFLYGYDMILTSLEGSLFDSTTSLASVNTWPLTSPVFMFFITWGTSAKTYSHLWGALGCGILLTVWEYRLQTIRKLRQRALFPLPMSFVTAITCKPMSVAFLIMSNTIGLKVCPSAEFPV